MLFNFANRKYSDEPTPDFETLTLAVNDASDYCETLSREMNRQKEASSFKYVFKFYSDSFAAISTKILAINKLGATFRNEVYSISRDLTEIIVDGAWIWFFFEFENKPELAETLCRQFYHNAKAHFIKEYDLIKNLYLHNPFIREFYSKERLEKYKTDFQKIIGTYRYRKNWRQIPKLIELNQYKWESRCEKAGLVMERYAKLMNPQLYRNLSLLSAFSHWDSLQLEVAGEKLEEKTYHSNLNAHLGLIHDMINLGHHIINKPIPEHLRHLRQRIIW